MAYDGSLKFDTKIDSNGFSSGISKLKSTAMAAIGAIGAAFATGAIAKALVAQISLVEQYGSAINDQAQKIGITTKAYQELSYIFEQTGGSVDVLQMGIKTLSSAVIDGNKAFEQLGISLEDARAMSQEDLFNTVIDRLASMESGTLRTSLATDLFGRSASELAPLLNMGADGIAKMREEAASYGLIMTDTAVAATDKYGDAVTLAQKSGEALRNAMVGKLLPTLTNVALGFADIAKEATAAFNERGISGVIDVITDKFPVATAAVSGLVAAFAALLIVQAVQKGIAALSVVQAELTALQVAGTVTEWAEIGALTVKQVIVGILTGELKGAAAAQALFNATIAANPVMILVTAIGLLVGGIVLLSKNFDELYPEIAQTREELKALNKEVEESTKTFEDSVDAAEKQSNKFDGLIDTLSELSAAYSGSSIEQAQMQTICDVLNGSVSGLSVTFDAQTGKLSQTTQAMHDLVAAQSEATKSSAALKRYEEVLGQQIDAEFEKRKAQAEWEKYFDPTTGFSRASGASKYSFATRAAEIAAETNLEKANETLAETTSNTATFVEYLEEMGVTLPAVSDATETLAESTETLTEAEQRVVIAGIDVTDTLKDAGVTADDAATRLDTFTAAATNMFQKISTESEYTVQEMIDNLVANAVAIEQWGANIVTLGGKLPEELLQPLIDQGPEKMAGVMQTLADASDEELAALVQAFSDGGAAAIAAWYVSIGAGTKPPTPAEPLEYDLNNDRPIKKAMEDTASAIEEDTSVKNAAAAKPNEARVAFEEAIQTADFPSVSDDIVQAMVEELTSAGQLFFDAGQALAVNLGNGFVGHTPALIAAAREMAFAVSRAFYDNIDLTIPSPGGTTEIVKPGATGGGNGPTALLGYIHRVPITGADLQRITAGTIGGAGASGGIRDVNLYVQSVAETDNQIVRAARREFEEVIVYGR